MNRKNQRSQDVFHWVIRIFLPFIILSILLTNVYAEQINNQVQVPAVNGSRQDLLITTLFDNYSSNKELKIGWGFSCLIQGAEKTILFDIGSSDAVLNMDKLKIDPASIDVLVISHDHKDHTNGIHRFMDRNSKVTTFYVPHDSVKICESVFTTGEMGTNIKENALIIRTTKGLVVITGCAHPGIVRIVKKAKEMFPGEEIYLVMGGFHLITSGGQKIKQIVSELRKENVRKISPSHCTGDAAESLFKETFGADFIPGDVGRAIKIDGAFKSAPNNLLRIDEYRYYSRLSGDGSSLHFEGRANTEIMGFAAHLLEEIE